MATLNLTLTVPDANATDILDTFVTALGYQSTINGSPNPETKAQAAKRYVANYVKETYRHAKLRALIDADRSTVNATVDAIVIS